MKNAILTCAAALSLAAAVGEPLVAKKPDGSGDAKQPSVLQRVGGFVIDWSAAKGKYLFVNCQDQHDMGLVRALAGRMSEDYSWVFECPDGDKNVSSIAQAVAEKARLGALAATVFVSSADLPLMTVAPESNLAVVNVRALVADKPSKILSDNRLVREALRAFAFSLGTGYTSLDAGVMQPVSSAADLDRFSATFMPADSANAARRNGEKMGFAPYRRTTYKRACKEGWAPAPTNDFQRAVWEKIKAEQGEKPTNPIRILPGQKPQGAK